MKNNLLTEIKQLFEKEELLGINIPVPSYLFVQRYGREIDGDMKEIAALFGQKEWFAFSAGNMKNEEKLLTGFKMALERHSGVGKEYIGSILVEFSGKETEKEMEELLEYIDSQKHRLHCIYTVKATEWEEDIREQLENYGFVRVVQGEVYDAYEQIEIFEDTLKEYQFQMEEEAEHYIAEFFRKQKWQETDAVRVRIQNMAKEIVYNKLMEGENGKNRVRKEEVERIFRSLQTSKAAKRQIGFIAGGVEL